MSYQKKASKGVQIADEKSITSEVKVGEKLQIVNTIHRGCHMRLATATGTAPSPLLHQDEATPPFPGRIGFDYFTRVLLRLLGSEVEGREIQLGVIVGPKPVGGRSLVITEPDAELTDAEQESLKAPDTAVKVYRKKLVGRADGTIGQDALLVSPTDCRILGLVTPAANVEGKDTNSRYENVTKDSRYVAVWLKPTRSARIYRYGRLQTQVILLRDGLGWSIRIIPELVHDLEELIKSKIGNAPKLGLIDLIVRLAVDLSESRLGGSVYFVRDRKTFDAMVKAGADLRGDPAENPGRDLAGNVVVASCKQAPPREPIHNIPYERLIKLLSEDGAVVLGVHGDLLASRTYFIGPGGRHSIAKAVCDDTRNPVVGIVVSQDGPISLAAPGLPILREVDRERYL